MKELRLERVVLAVIVLSLPSLSMVASSTPGGVDKTVNCGMQPYFDCIVPQGWGVYKNPEFSSKKSMLFGLRLVGPRSPSGAFVRIEADYFAPGNRVHKSPEKYIRVVAQLDGGISLPGEKITPPEAAEFNGLPATRFTVRTYDFIRVTKTSDKKVAIQEEHLVIPAGKGFYVLEYTAPPVLINEYRPVFEKFKESFTMLAK